MSNLSKLQLWMQENNIDIFIVNRTDEFLGEFIAAYAERLKWVSNFSGSTGKAIILKDSAIIFIDGRYTFQTKDEVDNQIFQIEHLVDFWKRFKTILSNNFIIGLDPSLHSKDDIDKINKIANDFESRINFLEINPIDILWENQPLPPQSKAFIQDVQYSGKSIEEKIKQIQTILVNNKINYYLLTALDSIAWLLNIRGNDISHTPLSLSYAIITSHKKVELFIDQNKIQDIQSQLNSFVNFHTIESIKNYIVNISSEQIIGMDQTKTPFVFDNICNENNITCKYFDDPCTYPKAQKNSIELKGAKKANIRDGVSVTKFLYWLKNKMIINETNEMKAAKFLLDLRKKNKLFYSLSFNTISAVGKHAALPHYQATKKSNLPFKKNTIYLFDSGAQYRDGTTDITRTIIIGKATNEQKDRFTRVLKGHIAIATNHFRINSKGSQLDPLARKSLQEIDCDYDHGTGHGIGSFLSVHEGPQRIAKSQGLSDDLIKEGMILSNEPGYYKEGEYGIRIENLIAVIKHSDLNLQFETISWAPIDIELININILSFDEIIWLNNYHRKVYEKLKDKLNVREKKWLQKVTQPIS